MQHALCSLEGVCFFLMRGIKQDLTCNPNGTIIYGATHL